MIAMAGDALTEVIAGHCLVDFATAEQIKIDAGVKDVIEYTDVMFLPQSIPKAEVLNAVDEVLKKMTKDVAAKIRELNGNKSVSAVFIVGGGGKIPGYTDALADELEIARERVAIRGEELMQHIIFEEDGAAQKDSLLVTPIGICLNYYEQSNNFIFVSFNGERIKIYDNNRLAVVDAAMQAQFPNDALFPKRGPALNFYIGENSRMVRGQSGEAAVITVNGEVADIYTAIHGNDVIVVKESTAGEAGRMSIGDLKELKEIITINVNDKKVELPKFAWVNGELQSEYYEIQENDEVELMNYYTVKQITEFMDVVLDPEMNIYVNNMEANDDTPVYENFSVVWTLEKIELAYEKERAKKKVKEEAAAKKEAELQAADIEDDSHEEDHEEEYDYDDDYDYDDEYDDEEDAHIDERHSSADIEASPETDASPETPLAEATPEAPPASSAGPSLGVVVNQRPVLLTGKEKYVYVDVFEYIDFDLNSAKGRQIITQINGRAAQFMEPLNSGDIIEIYWKS
jgi:hypothetical protein